MRIHLTLALLPLVAAACAANPPAAEPGASPATALAYGATAPDTFAYDFADTTISAIQGGAIGQINVSIGSRGTMTVQEAPTTSGVQNTLTVTDFTGKFSNSAGGGDITAAATDVRGPAVLTVTPRGEVTFVQRPDVTLQFRTVAGTDNVFRRLFLRLPGGGVSVGATWSDTITIEENNEGVVSRTRNIVRSTYARDTTIADRSFAVINSVAERTLEVSGVSQGIDIRQNLQGSANGVTIWDPRRRRIVSRQETVDMRGTFDLPGMGMSGMPMTASGSLRVNLRGN